MRCKLSPAAYAVNGLRVAAYAKWRRLSSGTAWTISIEPIDKGTERSTTRTTFAKSYLSGALKRERGAGAGGGAEMSASSLDVLAAAVDLLAHAEHAAKAAIAQDAGRLGHDD